MPAKTKKIDRKDFEGVNDRDCFQTPRYATELLIPDLQGVISRRTSHIIWECAAGDGRIARVLHDNGYPVISTDLKTGTNFLTGGIEKHFDIIVSNPPFSLKEEFLRKCLAYDVPFALLIPFEMNGWLVEAFDKWDCQGLVPNRRINYITPNTLQRIHEGEVWRLYKDSESYKHAKGNLLKFKKEHPVTWLTILGQHPDYCKYATIDDAPQHLLHRYSSSDFHSFWLVRHFNLPRQLTFVNLPIKDMKTNI